MPKTRLNARDRDALIAHSERLIVCKREGAAESAALDALRDAVGEALDRFYPVRDMKVLARYDVVGTPEHVELWNPEHNGSVRRSLDFAERAYLYATEGTYAAAAVHDRAVVVPVPQGRMVPAATRAGCGLVRINVPDEAFQKPIVDGFYAWQAAFNAHVAALSEKRKDYRTLIANSATWEALIEVWAEAEALKTKRYPTTALAVFDPNLVKRIKADVAARASA